MDDPDKYPSQLAERFQVRLPDGMRDKLKEAAESNKRSMNAEIVARLANSFSEEVEGATLATSARNSISRSYTELKFMYDSLCERLERSNRKLDEEYVELKRQLDDLRQAGTNKPV